MIEFKAECGHTVRAKDDDAGGVVRCSYCGRNAAVPDSREDDLDFLFRDVGEQADSHAVGSGKRRRGWLFRKRARVKGQFDLFAVILKMCYAAALISIVIVLGNKFVLPLFEEGGFSNRVARRAKATGADRAKDAPERRKRPRRVGLVNLDPLGLYVASTPARARVYFVEVSQAPSRGRIRGVAGAKETIANTDSSRVADGSYVVEVALPTHYPSLNDSSLPYYEEYLDFRRGLERASDAERSRMLDDFFVPDEALRVFIDQTEEVYYIVRQYRNIRVHNGRSKGVRALFLPKIRSGGRRSFSIASLVSSYLPKERAYVFNESHVRSELKFYGVPHEDLQLLVDSLASVGIVPYVTPDERTRLFRIDIHDGMCTGKVIREAGE